MSIKTDTSAIAKQAPGAWAGEAQAATSKVLRSFEAAIANVESLGREVWGTASKGVSPADASLLINKAKASIIDIDSAAKRTPGSTLPDFASSAISDIYSSLTRVIPHGSKSTGGGWVASAPSQERKNLASYHALGALVSKLTKP